MAARLTPPPSPPSPTASFYDVSDDEEVEYNKIAHSKSGKGVKLLFSKSKVCKEKVFLTIFLTSGSSTSYS
jgi:TBC1 domain family member 15